MLEMNPDARATFLDFYEPLLDMAKKRLAASAYNAENLLLDYGRKDWIESLPVQRGYDLVVSGFSIHHQPDIQKNKSAKKSSDY